MGNIMASLNTGVSGLQTAQASLNVTSHNVSNAATKGYVRQQVIVTDHTYHTSRGTYSNLLQVGLGTDISAIRQVRNTFLDGQYRTQLGRQSFYESQSETMSEIEDLFGEMNGEQFSTSVTSLWSAAQELAKTPNDIVKREQLVSTATSFVERASVLQSQLSAYQTNLNTEIKDQVSRINEITAQIKELNDSVRRYEATGQKANDFRDKRNTLLDELGGYIEYTATEDTDGTVNVYSQGQYLVSTEASYDITTKKVNESTNMLKVVWADSNGKDFFDLSTLKYSMEDNNDIGSLKGLLIARGNKSTNYTDVPVRPNTDDFKNASGVVDQTAYQAALTQFNYDTEIYNATVSPSVIMTVQAQLDQLVHGIATMVNDILAPNKDIKLQDGSTITVLDEDKAPVGDDANKTKGTELFSRKSTDRYEKVTVVLADGTSAQVYKYNKEDKTDAYSLYTVSELEVNQNLVKDPSLLPLTANANSGYVDGYTMETVNAILTAWKGDFKALDPNNLTVYTVNTYYNAMIGQLATQGEVWNSIVSNQTDLVTTVDDQRQTVMGVSTDEELVNLVKYQHSYNASSRYITVIDEMIEHLITRLGS